jgi:V8-like Glu-specific endopeptidase
MGELDMCIAQPGDSGSPIYKKSRAFGILAGGLSMKPWHCFEIYQGIRGAEKALSFDILLAR